MVTYTYPLQNRQLAFDGIQIVPRTRGDRVDGVDSHRQAAGNCASNRSRIAARGYPRMIDADRSEYKFNINDNSHDLRMLILKKKKKIILHDK